MGQYRSKGDMRYLRVPQEADQLKRMPSSLARRDKK
jgi:hypothetical protein